MNTLLIFLFAAIILRLIYELIKGIHNSKISRQYPRLNKGDRVIYREIDESGVRNTPATVIWQNGPLVRIQPDVGGVKVGGGIEITVERTDLKIDEK